MIINEVVVEGLLKADGTVELSSKPGLAPGPVTIVLRQATAAIGGDDWWQFMQRARQELLAEGNRLMTEEEMNAHIEELRAGDRIDELLR